MSEYSRNVAEAKFSLVICGESIPFEEIVQKVSMEPTRTISTGELLNSLPEIVAKEDAWFHTIQLSMPEGRDPALLGMLGTIAGSKDYLDSLIANGIRVMLRLYVRSDRATLAYRLTPDTIKALQDIGYPLDVTTVSWGDVGI